MSSKHLLRAWLAAAFILWASSVLAAPLRITGTVRGETGAAQNVQVELFPAYESYADALRRLTEKQAPAPLATARAGARGTYELRAPEKGCFRVVVRAEGHLPVEVPFLPLVEHLELPTAFLVRDGDDDRRPPPPWSRVEEPPAGDSIRVRIEARNPQDQPVPQALIRREGVPIAITGRDGRLEVAIPRDGAPLTVESREGEQARIAVPANIRSDGSEAVPIRLEALRRISGLSRVFSGGIELKAEHLILIPRAMGLEPAEFFHLAYPPRRSDAASSASTQLQQALRDLQPAPQEAPPADAMSDEQLQRVLFATLKKFMGREGRGDERMRGGAVFRSSIKIGYF